MHRFRNYILLLFAITSLSSLNSCSDEKITPKPPNIILILADDLGWKDVAFMGNTIIETPHLDKLSSQGMTFTNAYSNAPNCAPTRACLLSGKYSPRHGIYTVNSSKRGKSENRKLIPIKNKTVLDSNVLTLPELLKTAGYVTATMGKWHLGEDPTSQGFDINIGGDKKGHPKSYFSPYKNKNLKDRQEGEHLTDRLTTEAIDFVSENKDQPFFLYLPYFAVHTPFQAKENLVKKYSRKIDSTSKINPTYAAMVETMDVNIGRLLATIDSLNLTGNTIIIFTSDNGNHQNASSAAPLRGSKGMLYEGGIRVPFIIKWKNEIEAGSTCPEPIISLDLYPTILDLIEHEKISKVGEIGFDASKLDGQSISPLLFQIEKLEREALFWHFPAYLERYRGSQKKWRQTPASAIRLGDWKLIETFETGDLELFNLKDDIGESKNLAEKYPEKAQKLFEVLKNWRANTDAPVPTELNPEYISKTKY